jgi:hypothetical protein
MYEPDSVNVWPFLSSAGIELEQGDDKQHHADE